jgi:hypothetical protein
VNRSRIHLSSSDTTILSLGSTVGVQRSLLWRILLSAIGAVREREVRPTIDPVVEHARLANGQVAIPGPAVAHIPALGPADLLFARLQVAHDAALNRGPLGGGAAVVARRSVSVGESADLPRERAAAVALGGVVDLLAELLHVGAETAAERVAGGAGDDVVADSHVLPGLQRGEVGRVGVLLDCNRKVSRGLPLLELGEASLLGFVGRTSSHLTQWSGMMRPG